MYPDDVAPPDMITLEQILQRSDALEDAIMQILDPSTYATYDNSKRIVASFNACNVSVEHAKGLRTLIQAGLPTPAVSLMRLQYEAVVRSVWLLYAASDIAVEKLETELTADTEKAASRLPMLAAMLKEIDGKAPAAATLMLTQFKDVMASALNSFVHGGIHALQRTANGYPLPLIVQIVKSSNALFTMSGMIFAILNGNPAISKRMREIQPAFADCLPELLGATIR